MNAQIQSMKAWSVSRVAVTPGKIRKIRKARVTRDKSADVAVVVNKFQALQASTIRPLLKLGDIFEDGVIKMKCVKCLVFYPRTPEYFYLKNFKNFVRARAGWESLSNSAKNPCIKCMNKLTAKLCDTEDGFVCRLLQKYPELTNEWFYQTLKKQASRGAITNVVMKLTTNQSNCVGIHRKDNSQDHRPENCFLEVQELNVQQWDAIPDLTEAWKCVFQHFVNAFTRGCEDTVDHMQLFRDQLALTPKDLGLTFESCGGKNAYCVQCYKLHFQTCLERRIRNNIERDLKKKRLELVDGISVKQLGAAVYPNALNQLEKQHGCCFYSQIGLTHIGSWSQLSLERLDNNLPHFTNDGQLNNCVFICRLFNVPKQLSTTLLLQYFLEQKLVAVSAVVRERVESVLSITKLH